MPTLPSFLFALLSWTQFAPSGKFSWTFNLDFPKTLTINLFRKLHNKQIETGHAKNVANFETVTIILLGLGAVYNPSQALIILAALQTKLTAAKAVMAAIDTAGADKAIAIDEREAEFEDLEKYAVNIKRTAEVEVNDEAFTKDLASIIRKLQGGRAGEKPVDDPNTPDVNESLNANSVSQRSYDSLIAHLADLIALLKTKSSYNPNDVEMQIPSIEAKLAALETKNNAAKTAIAAYGNAMDTRDEVLYNNDTGIIKLLKLIKTQLARKPGRDSTAYKQVTALEFRKSRAR